MTLSAPRVGDCAWLAILAGIVGYELVARDGELLSESADRYMAARPWTTRVVVAVIAAHLINLTPDRFDPWLWFVHGCARVRGLAWGKAARMMGVEKGASFPSPDLAG